MKIKIKKLHPDAKIPSYSKEGDAGMDLYCVSVKKDKTPWERSNDLTCHTGIAMEIPAGYVGLLFPRSSISKTNLFLRNAVGVIDSGYRGEIILKFGFYDGRDSDYEVGDRVGQIMILPYPQVQFVETDELTSSERGDGGFGSTGVKGWKI